MTTRLILFLLLLLVSCKESGSKGETSTSGAIQDMKLDGFWTYRTADYFWDGGSFVMGFINGNGEVLYVFFDYSLNMSKNYRPCWLKRTYNDSGAVEILPGSELERKVLTLIENADYCSKELEAMLPSRSEAMRIIRSRDLKLKLTDGATEASSQMLPEQPDDLINQVHGDLGIIRGVKQLWAGPPLAYSGPAGADDSPGPRHSRDETPSEEDLASYFQNKKLPAPPVGRYVIHRVDQAPEFRVTLEELDDFTKSKKEAK